MPTTCRATIIESGTVTTVQITASVQTTTCASSWTVPSGISRVQTLIVGGGGSGAVYYGGGGGGGGVTAGFYNVTAGSTYNLSVGGGGARAPGSQNSRVNGIDGSSSSFTIGGTTYSAPGGHGGLGCIGTGIGGSFTCSNTNTGGAAGNSSGGDGGVGVYSTGIYAVASSGGAGFASSITGTSFNYGPGGTGASGYIEYAASAADDTGGGGDGVRNAELYNVPTVYSGAGAAGTIVIRYKTVPPVITGPNSSTGSTSAISIPENSTQVYTFTASESVVWTIGGTDGSFFSINETGTLTISARDFETPVDVGNNNTYIVDVTGTDGFGSSVTQTLTVTITNVNEAPVITTNSSSPTYAITQTENVLAVATFTGTDVDAGQTKTWTISGTDFDDFSINSSTGALTFKNNPNYEAPTDSDTNNVYTVIVTLSDGTLTDTQTVTVTVTNINDAPVISTNSSNPTYAISQAEAAATGIAYAGNDEDSGATLTWSISGTDAARFAINSSTGALTFASTPNFEAPTDSDGNNSYIVVVSLSDGTLSDSQTATITITNTNEAPVITNNLSAATYAFSQAEGISTVATYTGTDVDAATTLTWSLSGTDAARFTINTSTGVMAFASTPNFEAPADSDTNNIYVVNVVLSDGSLSDTQTVTITITDINEAPVITTNSSNATYSLSQAETAATGVAFAGTDQDTGTVLTWSKSGTDAAAFTINSSTGALTFATTPDFETPTDSDGNNSYIVVVTLTDGSLSDSQTVTITITNTNEAPIITTNSSAATYAISQPEGQLSITTFTASDVDSGTVLSWAISGIDSATVSINSSTGALTFKAAPDYEAPIDNGTNNTYIFVVTVSDGTLTDSQTVTVTILDINDAPTITTNGSASTYAISVPETATAVTTFTGSDVDAGATLSWSISGTDAADLVINASTGALSFITKPDYENPSDSDANNTYIVIVTLSDGSLTDVQTVTITVTNVNEAPTITTNSSNPTYAISQREGRTSVVTFAGTDPDAGSSLTWSISGTDAGDFTINSSTGVFAFAAVPNFSTPADSDTNNIYTVVVTLSDGSLTDTQTVTVTITNVNEAPVITTNGSVAAFSTTQLENQREVVTYAGTDPDPGTTLTWSISGVDAAAFSINSSTGALSFITAPDYDAPIDDGANNTYTVIVTLSDGSLTDTQVLEITIAKFEDLSGYFDGNTYLSTTDGASFLRPNDTDFTVEAWFKPDTACASKACVILDKPNQYLLTTAFVSSTGGGVVLCGNLKGFRSTFQNPLPISQYTTCFLAARVSLGNWNHAMISVKRNQGDRGPIVTVYFNGYMVWMDEGSNTDYFSDAVSGNEPLYIGGGTTFVSSTYFVGEIDQVRVSRYAETIQLNGTSPAVNTTNRLDVYQPDDGGNLIAHYDFNEESGTVINRAPNASPGTNLTVSAGSLIRKSVATLSVSGNRTTYTFPRSYLTASGGWRPPSRASANVLVVGGGGAGGMSVANTPLSGGGGGGGAGEYWSATTAFNRDTVTVIVGMGGTSSYWWDLPTGNGRDSQLHGFIVKGGGAGGSYKGTVSTNGTSGGSGGGGATLPAGYNGSGLGGASNRLLSSAFTASFGSNGGQADRAESSYSKRRTGGGGGGAGGAGVSSGNGNTEDANLGNGGAGKLNSISGVAICYATGGGGGDQNPNYARTQGGGCSTANSVNGNGGSANFAGNDARAGTGSGGGGTGKLGFNETPRGGAGGSGIVIVQYFGTPTFGEPPAVETVTAGVVHRFSLETSSDPNITRTFNWYATNGTPNSWTSLGHTGSYYDFKSPGSNYLETTTSGSAYSFKVTITDTDLSSGISTTRDTNPFYVVVNPRNQITRSSYTYNETTTTSNLALTSIAFGTTPFGSWSISSKYGDTVTAVLNFAYGTDTRTATVDPSVASSSGTIEWSNSSSSGITLKVKPTLTPGTYYETLTVTDNVGAFTILALTINRSKADTITVVTQIAGQSNYTMSYGGTPAPTAIRTVTGLKNSDTLTALSTVVTRTGTSLIFQASNCASGGTCSVGDLAPGGGIVFAVSSIPLAAVGGISGGGIYLATAPEVIGARTWCNSTSIGASALSATAGDGAFNTSILTSNCSLSSNAGRSVSEIYDINGYDDWFLPTTGDLAFIKSRLVDRGLLSLSGELWSSSTNGTSAARSYSMSSGSIIDTALNLAVTTEKNVLPIRAFSPKIIDIYNSPTDAGSYTVTAQIEMASPGTFANYQGVQYTNATITINRAAQTPLKFGQFTAIVGSSYPFNVYGGSGPGALVRSLVNAGTANCSYNSATYLLTATAPGNCSVQAIKAGTPNYLSATVTDTIYWTKFIEAVVSNSAPSSPLSIPVATENTVTKKTEVVTSSSFLDTNDQPIVGAVSRGATIRIVISGFEGLTPDDLTVYFKPYEDAQVVTVTSTYVQVVVPATAVTGKIAIDGPRGVAYSPSLSVNP